MTARAFLVRGLLVGLLAGLAAFVVGYTVAEPHMQAAIDYEESQDAAPAAEHEHAAGEDEGHHHEEDGTVVTRHDQRTWGLLTGALGIGAALGGLVALVSAALVGRLGRLMPGQTVALVALIGWVSVILVPFLKYPASPPAVGNAETIGSRTGEYFAFVLISVAFAAIATVVALRMRDRFGTYAAVVTVSVGYLVVMIVAGQLMPTVNEVGDFPADTLWYFRRASLMTTGTMWAVIGVVLGGLVGRLFAAETSSAQRRELAASL